MRIHIASAILLIGFMAAPAPVQAQQEFIRTNTEKIIRKLGVRANISVRNSADTDVTKPTKPGLAVMLGGGRKEGLKFPVSITSYSENLLGPSGDQFGSLKAYAIMGGVGYGWNVGRLSTGADIQAGVAYNRGRIDGDSALAFRTDGPVSISVGNSLIARPRLKAEYFITEKFTVKTSADYIWTRPSIAVTTVGGRISDRWDMSHYHLSVGVAFYPFRKE
jgi:hypothetical protein